MMKIMNGFHHKIYVKGETDFYLVRLAECVFLKVSQIYNKIELLSFEQSVTWELEYEAAQSKKRKLPADFKYFGTARRRKHWAMFFITKVILQNEKPLSYKVKEKKGITCVFIKIPFKKKNYFTRRLEIFIHHSISTFKVEFFETFYDEKTESFTKLLGKIEYGRLNDRENKLVKNNYIFHQTCNSEDFYRALAYFFKTILKRMYND